MKKLWNLVTSFFRKTPRVVPNSFYDDISQLYYKKNGLLMEAEQIESIVLGNSQARYLVNPQHIFTCFYNLGASSMDFYSIYHLYRQLDFLPRLKRVFIVYSLYHEHFNLSHSSMRFRCVIMERLWDIPNPGIDPITEDLSGIDSFLKNPISPKQFFRGYDFPAHFLPKNACIEKRVERLLSFDSENQWEYMEALLQLCFARGHYPVIVIAPDRSDYVQLLLKKLNYSSVSVLLQPIMALAEKFNIPIINARDFAALEDDDFGDINHLNTSGTQKFSERLADYLKDPANSIGYSKSILGSIR